jgi:hypothetical protein
VRLPVRAQGDSVLYRTRKFAARHRAALAVSGFALLLAGGVVATTTEAQRVRQERLRAQKQAQDLQQAIEILNRYSPHPKSVPILPGSYLPIGWSAEQSTTGQYQAGVDRDFRYDGDPTLSLRSLVPHPSGNVEVIQAVTARQYRGRRVKLSAFLRSANGSAQGSILLRAGPTPAEAAFDHVSLYGAGAWKKCELVLDIPMLSDRIEFGVRMTGAGTLWAARFSLEHVNRSVPLTQPTQPRNLDYSASPFVRGAIPDGWWLSGAAPADYESAVDPSSSYNGKPSAYLRGKQATSGFGTLMQDFSAERYVGKRIRFGAYVKTSNLRAGAGLWMRVDEGYGTAAQMLAMDNMNDRLIRGTTEWQFCEVVLDVPNDASTIALGILSGGTGSVWLNSASLQAVPMSVPTTRPLIPIKRPPLDSPMNLRFNQAEPDHPIAVPEVKIHAAR